MEPQSPQYPYADNELTLRDVLLGIISYAKLLWRRKWWILGAGLLGAAIFGYLATRQPVTYQGSLTFMLNEEEGGGGGLASILGQVGLGGGASSEYNLEKIVELSKSQLIMQRVLLDTISVGGTEDRLAHHLMTVYDLRAQWRENGREDWATVHFAHDSLDGWTRTERKIIQVLHKKLVGGGSEAGLLNTTIDPNTNILRMRGESLHEEFTQQIVEKAYQHLSEFYVEKVTAGPRSTYRKLKTRTDSIQGALQANEIALASSRDASLGLIQARDRVKIDRLQRKNQLLNVMYGEAVKNLATAEFTLSTMTPFFAVVDRPFLPLGKINPSWFNAALRAGVIAIFIIMGGLVCWRIIQKTLEQPR
ncbi:hypothetical protein [Lewinella sp. W8]|uniref:hypothetical protein n=1 Tax=Lewinella sp. W8 TaxID=2528208 RepID=UPI001068D13C|nr:hypothetical protein [Lewinella sp. W8]MTB53166.1 hypothetical protein [Lewinella sp. W8]